MKFKWEMWHGCIQEVFYHNLEEIEQIVAESVKSGRPRPHKPMREFNVGDFLPMTRDWAKIERIE